MGPSHNATALNERSVVNLVVARLLDYFARRTDWQRRLWNPGTVTVLRELLEAVDLLESGHLRSVTVKELAGTARRRAGPDLGMGSQASRSALETALSRLHRDPADLVARHQLDFLLEGAEPSYFERWGAADPSEVAELGPESISRLLAGHLLGTGFSPDYLHRWATWLTTNRLPQDLADVFTEAQAVAVRPTRSWVVFVPFIALERHDQRMPPEWLEPEEATAWMSRQVPEALVRHNGGLLIEVEARDRWSAVEEAGDLVESLAARVAVGVPGSPRFEPHTEAFVAGSSTGFSLTRPRRQVDVHSFKRQDSLFVVGEQALAGRLRSAIDLVTPLETGTPGAAVAGGWAALEAVLARPDTSSVQAASDLAALVACSFPRAELTPLAYAYFHENDDQLSESLRQASSNLQRCAILGIAIDEGLRLGFRRPSDEAALERVRSILADPGAVLARVCSYVEETMQRLYRQRNMVLHAGKTDSVAMSAVLRTAPPLVGAGLDRLVHDALAKGESDPLRLVARARTALDSCGKEGSPRVWDLLGH